LAWAGIAVDTLLGHEVKGSTGAKTYTMRATEDLKGAMSMLAYPGLALPCVFVAPVVDQARPAVRKGRRPGSVSKGFNAA